MYAAEFFSDLISLVLESSYCFSSNDIVVLFLIQNLGGGAQEDLPKPHVCKSHLPGPFSLDLRATLKSIPL